MLSIGRINALFPYVHWSFTVSGQLFTPTASCTATRHLAEFRRHPEKSTLSLPTFLHIEWSGEKRILEILTEHGYQIYDSIYVVIPKENNIQPYQEIGFQCINKIKLSIGKPAYEMVFKENSKSPIEAIDEVNKRNLGWIHTDLIAINPNLVKQFLYAVNQYIMEYENNKKNYSS